MFLNMPSTCQTTVFGLVLNLTLGMLIPAGNVSTVLLVESMELADDTWCTRGFISMCAEHKCVTPDSV